MLGVEVEKCLVRRAAREREEEEDVVGGEKEDEGGAAEVGGASVADVRQTRREAVEETVSEGHENPNPSRPKGVWARAIGYGGKTDEVIDRWDRCSVWCRVHRAAEFGPVKVILVHGWPI
jgi:hypothetical protein